MKKCFYTLMALVALVSCVKENDNSGIEAQAPAVQLTIHAGHIKTSIAYDGESENYIPSWGANDALGVLVDEFVASKEAADGTLTNASAGTTASFTGSVTGVEDGTHTAYAFYPARAFYGTESGKIVDLEIPYIQFPSASSFDPKADLLAGVPKEFTVASGEASDINDMQFRRIPAILKVTLQDVSAGISSDQIKSVKIESGSEFLSGKFCYDFTNGDAAASQMEAVSSFKHVTADFTENPMAFSGNAIYLLVNPCTLSAGTTLTVKVITDKHEIVKVSTLLVDFIFESGAVRPLNVKLNNTDSIEDVYFQDNFDWIFKYWDGRKESNKNFYYNAYDRNRGGDLETDPVGKVKGGTHGQVNVYTAENTIIGTAFQSLGYLDLNPSAQTVYVQENYVKTGATNKQTALQLPPIAFGDIPVDVTLKFRWCRHITGAGNVDTVPLVVEILNGGTCSDSGTTISEVFTTAQAKNQMFWTDASINLIGVTSSSRIVFKEDYANYEESGAHRFFLDEIKVIPLQSASFPIVWTFDPANDTREEGVDYLLMSGSFAGSYIYSDNHQGKINVNSVGGNAGTDPEYRVFNDTEQSNGFPNEKCFIHYKMGFHSYWEFVVNDVKNPAGTYTIQYQMSSSGAAPRHFLLEYTLDDDWSNPVPIAANDTTPDSLADASPNTVSYTYAVTPSDTAIPVNYSFHLDAMNAFKTLRIRAYVVSKIRSGTSTANLAANVGGNNRIFGTPTISFVAD